MNGLERLQEIERLAQVGTWEWDVAANEVRWSDELYRIFGLEPASLRVDFARYLSFVHPDDRVTVRQAVSGALKRMESYEFEHRIVRSDGTTRVVLGRGSAVSENGAVVRLHGTAQDITEHADAVRALRDSEEHLRLLVENAPIGITVVRLDGSFERVNPTICRIVGYPEAELLTRTFQDITHPDDLDADLELVARTLAGEIPGYELEKRYIRSDGETVWVLLSVTLLRDYDGSPVHFISQVVDINDRKKREQEVLWAAHHDPLTGLWNRRRFEEELERELHFARRYGNVGSVLFLDLDDFKKINDDAGHAAGDAVLMTVAAGITKRLRSTDVAARLGGDEFVILLSHTRRDEAELVARELLEDLARSPVVEAGISGVSVSMGIAGFSAESGSLPLLLQAADRAMYRAKRRGSGIESTD